MRVHAVLSDQKCCAGRKLVQVKILISSEAFFFGSEVTNDIEKVLIILKVNLNLHLLPKLNLTMSWKFWLPLSLLPPCKQPSLLSLLYLPGEALRC